MQVIPLDITVELQKQIMSELEILYKVSGRTRRRFYLGRSLSQSHMLCFELEKSKKNVKVKGAQPVD